MSLAMSHIHKTPMCLHSTDSLRVLGISDFGEFSVPARVTFERRAAPYIIFSPSLGLGMESYLAIVPKSSRSIVLPRLFIA